MAKKKRAKARRASARKRAPRALEVKVWLGVLFLLVFLVGSMTLLKVLSDKLLPAPPSAVPQVAQPDPVIRAPEQQVAIPDEAVPSAPAPMPVTEPVAESSASATAPGLRVAIIVDDLGQDLFSARTLLELDLALTFAVLPDLPYSAPVAQLAHQRGREVIVHIPMQPQDYPTKNPGVNALLAGLSAEEVLRRLQSHLGQIPHAVGGNNHMGSRFTQDQAGMRVVMSEMARRDLFFVDSVTTNGSVVRSAAAEFGVPHAARDVFLDNVQDVDKIRQELHRLIRVAKKKGSAIAICHPYRETLEALRLEQETFAREGVRVVPVSQLLRRG